MKIQRALLLAASDMDQAIAAAKALERESEDVHLMRALETSLVVSYARAFTTSSLHKLDREEYRPRDAELAQMHDELITLRDRAYAHTDKQSGRDVTMTITATTGFQEGAKEPAKLDMTWREEWLPLSREAIPAAITLCEGQRAGLREEAAQIQATLDGIVWRRYWPATQAPLRKRKPRASRAFSDRGAEIRTRDL
ncbi:MAG: hypothetical protein ABIR67_15125 [Gaiellaceae bacterium]